MEAANLQLSEQDIILNWGVRKRVKLPLEYWAMLEGFERAKSVSWSLVDEAALLEAAWGSGTAVQVGVGSTFRGVKCNPVDEWGAHVCSRDKHQDVKEPLEARSDAKGKVTPSLLISYLLCSWQGPPFQYWHTEISSISQMRKLRLRQHHS